jgi:hypothetical protein
MGDDESFFFSKASRILENSRKFQKKIIEIKNFESG